MDLATIWEIAKTIGPGGTVLCILLWLDERRERRRIQSTVVTLHRENTRRLERLLRKADRLARVAGVPATNTAKSGATRRRGGK